MTKAGTLLSMLESNKTIADAKAKIMEIEHYSSTDSIEIISSYMGSRVLDDDEEIQGTVYIVSLDSHGGANVYVDAPNKDDAAEAAEEWWLEFHPKEKSIEAGQIRGLKL